MKRYLVLLSLFTGLYYGNFAKDTHFIGKSTGKGNGLEVSLTYDTVVNGHVGIIEVDTKEREYTEFTIKQPIQL